MNSSTKTAAMIFCYISTGVGMALAFANAAHKPAATGAAFGYGLAAAIFLVLGFVITFRESHR